MVQYSLSESQGVHSRVAWSGDGWRLTVPDR